MLTFFLDYGGAALVSVLLIGIGIVAALVLMI
jgi:hypothetical protein